MKKTILLFSMLVPFFVFSQNITNITPNQAMQGQTIPLIISGNNMSFSGWSCWSNTGNLSDFRFSQWSGTNMLYGTSISATATQVNGSLSVPAFQPIGIYNLEVFDCLTSWWIQFPNSFQINAAATASWNCMNSACIDPGTGNGTYASLAACNNACIVIPQTWDCVGNSCIDPGDGNGTFTTVASCQANCAIQPSWDCFPNANSQIWDCVDPGTGTGEYTVLSFCDAACSANAIDEEASDILIYPNPAKNTLTIDGNYISATIHDIFGKVVLTTYFHQKTIDIAVLMNGIYFLHIKTKNSISIKKITINK